MDEEEQFAQLLSQSRAPSAPSWNTPSAADDPWANPFSDAPSTHTSDPYSSPFGAASTYTTTLASDPSVPADMSISGALRGFGTSPESPRIDKSPYVQRLEDDAAVKRSPDPPSVIAAREQASFESPSRVGSGSGYIPPFEPPSFSPPRSALPADDSNGSSSPAPAPRSRGLPSDLIDEDLLAASDPSLSLKKAFVKSAAPALAPAKSKSEAKDDKPKAYVFTPSTPSKGKGKRSEEEKKEVKGEEAKAGDKAEGKLDDNKVDDKRDSAKDEVNEVKGDESKEIKEEPKEEPKATQESTEGAATDKSAQEDDTPKKTPAGIPLPESAAPTPTVTRPVSPSPSRSSVTLQTGRDTPEPSPATLAVTPTTDRVAVSPLEQSADESDFSFNSLSIGAASIAPTPPAKDASDGWGSSRVSPPTSTSRFGGKGWGALDDEDDGGLFGKGGPSVRASDAWDSGAGDGGWGEPGVASLPVGGSSTVSLVSESTESKEDEDRPVTPPADPTRRSSAGGRTPKLLSKPLFHISVGDPTRVGDPVRGYTVYTVRTRTTSPHYRKGEFSVLRRFSDFLWLFETLTANNPGVIVPPVPDKHAFGRFQDTFIETRRMALERCLTKITSHPVLQLDPDLRLFLESDQFAAEAKSRKAEQVQEKSSLLSGWTGNKFVEQDDWFDSRRSFLDSLESQLRGLSKSIEVASRSRLELATVMGDFASAVAALQDSDLGSAMSAVLARLSDLAHREKEVNEENAKAEVVHLLNLSDEYVRFISSVRLAFASRIKCFERWQTQEKEVVRLRTTREKLRQQGKLGDRVNSSLAEIGEAERKSRDQSTEFEAVSRLVKSEFGRFEKERVDEFAKVLERYLDGLVGREKTLIAAWEEYHGIVLKMVQKAQA